MATFNYKGNTMVKFDKKGRQQVQSLEGILFHVTKRKVDVHVFEGEKQRTVINGGTAIVVLMEYLGNDRYTFWAVI